MTEKNFTAKINEKYAVTAANFKDLYPKGFHEFFEKYKSVKDPSLYVNFSNFNDNTIDKKAWVDTDHTDPVGIYAYPLDYVIKHPADIWYGRTAKFIRVIKKTAKKPLYLSHITSESQAISILSKMGFKDSDLLMKEAWKWYKDRIGKNQNKVVKTMFTVIQMKLDEGTKDDTGYKTKMTHPMRSGAEQTALLKKAGYDCVVDESKNDKQAVINEREPLQAIFLTRSSLNFIDVFDLRSGKGKNGLTLISPEDLGLSRKLAAAIASKLDDRLVSNENNLYYWTKKGRQIHIDWFRPDSYYQNRSMFEKKHKEVKTYDHYFAKVTLLSERGEIKWSSESKDTIEKISKDVLTQFKLHDVDESFTPITKESFHKGREEEKQKNLRAQLAKKKKQQLESLPENLKDFKEVAEMVGVGFKPPEGEAEGLDFLSDLCSIAGALGNEVYEIEKERTPPLPLTSEEVDKVWAEIKTKDRVEETKSLLQAWDVLKKIYTTYSFSEMKSPTSYYEYDRYFKSYWFKRGIQEAKQLEEHGNNT